MVTKAAMMSRSLFVAALIAGCGSEKAGTPSAPRTPEDDTAVDRGRPPSSWPMGPAATPKADAGSAGESVTPPAGTSSGPFVCPTPKTGVRGELTIDLRVGGRDRSMIVHVPSKYDPKVGAPLVLSFHGYLMSAPQQRDISLLNATSDARGFVVAYPSGTGAGWNAGDCCGTATSGNVDDVGFVKAAISKLESDWCIDPKRVYASGFSNGGFLAHRLACEMADTFAAIAPVSGVLGVAPASCKPSRSISVIALHGTDDIVVPYNGGVPISPIDFGGPVTFRSVNDTLDFWRTTNRCLGSKVVYVKGDTTCVRDNCVDGTNVELCTIEGGGHTWPGGGPMPIPGAGKISTDIAASEAIADFFEAHTL